MKTRVPAELNGRDQSRTDGVSVRQLIVTNIEQSFRTLEREVPEYCDDFLELLRESQSKDLPFALHGTLTCYPVLYRRGDQIRCGQQDYFGFYALRQAVRRFFLSINHHVAGDLLVANKLYGPAVASYYSSAYHTLHAVLALEGRVFIESTIWPLDAESTMYRSERTLLGVLSQHNSWSFEGRNRDHRTKWRELTHAFPPPFDSVPELFHDLFAYFYRGQYESDVDLLDRLRSPERRFVSLPNHFEEFLVRIADARHQSIYRSFGSEPQVIEDLWNGEFASSEWVNERCVQFSKFSNALLDEVSRDIEIVRARIEPNLKVRRAFGFSVLNPWFDQPRIEAVLNPELRGSAKAVSDWVNKF